MKQHISDHILAATGAQKLIKTELIQSLWSGYGQISRCTLAGGSFDHVVVKHVQFPNDKNHPRGWNSSVSHDRKVKSYQVEMKWYSGFGMACDEHCRIPRLYHRHVAKDEMLMIMEDLNPAGYPIRKFSVNSEEIKACLDWLAHFHARFMGLNCTEIWDVGTYWHLGTRQEELDAMNDRSLQAAASAIDDRLNQAQYQTFVHGDAKLANFCFAANGHKVAAVDFQYVGHGCGMKDVAYFLSSCLHEDELTICETDMLSFYFESLREALNRYDKALEFDQIQEEWGELYKYAWADFYRFLDGWSPGHWKLHRYSESIKNTVLKELA